MEMLRLKRVFTMFGDVSIRLCIINLKAIYFKFNMARYELQRFRRIAIMINELKGK